MPQTPQTKHFSLQPHAVTRHQIKQISCYKCFRFPTVDPDFLQKKGQEFGFGEGSEERLNHWVEANIDKGYKQVLVPVVFLFSLLFHSLVLLAVSVSLYYRWWHRLCCRRRVF